MIKDKCEIEGVCYDSNEFLPNDVQFVCKPDVNNSTWTLIPTPGK